MADPLVFPIAPGLESLCRDAQQLVAVFPAPMVEKSGSWRPAPYDLAPCSAWLSGGMQPYTT